jgi:hypothetical protein
VTSLLTHSDPIDHCPPLPLTQVRLTASVTLRSGLDPAAALWAYCRVCAHRDRDGGLWGCMGLEPFLDPRGYAFAVPLTGWVLLGVGDGFGEGAGAIRAD